MLTHIRCNIFSQTRRKNISCHGRFWFWGITTTFEKFIATVGRWSWLFTDTVKQRITSWKLIDILTVYLGFSSAYLPWSQLWKQPNPVAIALRVWRRAAALPWKQRYYA
eukprot:4557873-Pyramimonas_sp.AAC.1